MDEIKDALYINNAGLVILAPYLPRFFEMLEMMEGNFFRTEGDAERAVHLLQYLATGQQETPEHLLVFNKILCGLPLDHPVPSFVEITESEASIVDSLLNGVLQNWDKMKDSTPENLRGSFLIRDGRLEEKGEHWALTVDSKAYDMLLNFLPWTISIVNLPCMKKRVEVDWKTSMG
ncbi:MAG: contractile injection system tape measure protein [Lewinella sp.]|uniref:contractile injection system tape measure protein n=1 Tax=Lewinella sp. TaxID=2004506 RepID=UPI003D6BEF20